MFKIELCVREETDEGVDLVRFSEREFKYIKDLICQQDDKYELVYQITKKLGGY